MAMVRIEFLIRAGKHLKDMRSAGISGEETDLELRHSGVNLVFNNPKHCT
jgi:hypothetical protein